MGSGQIGKRIQKIGFSSFGWWTKRVFRDSGNTAGQGCCH